MKISSYRLTLLARRYSLRIASLAEMLCLYPSTLTAMLREREYLELNEMQAENLIQWFGISDALLLMERRQRNAVITMAMA